MKRIFCISLFCGVIVSSLFVLNVVSAEDLEEPDISLCTEVVESLFPRLDWSNTRADYYNVYIGNFSPVVSYKNWVQLDRDYGLILNYNTVYPWSVEACNDTGECSKKSNVCYFTTPGDGSQPTPLTPTPPSSGPSYTGSPGTISNPLGYENFEDLVNAIINFLWLITTPLAAIMFVISGIMFVTSVGNPEKVKTAKNIALYTAIGYGIIIIASGLIKVLQSLLQGS